MPSSTVERANARPVPTVPRLIFATRWLQLPLYVGLILAQAVYVYHFWVELVHLVEAAFGNKEALTLLVKSIGYSPFFVALGVLDLIAAVWLWTMVRERVAPAPAPEAAR